MRKLWVVLSLSLCLFLQGIAHAEEKKQGVNFADYLGNNTIEATVYQPDKLAEAKNYQYDRFEEKWFYVEEYAARYADLSIVISVDVQGDAETCDVPIMRIEILDSKQEIYHRASSVQWWVDGTVFSFHNLIPRPNEENAYLYCGGVAEQLLDALQNAREVAVKVFYKEDTKQVILDPVNVDELSGMADWRRNTGDAGIWEKASVRDEYQTADEVFAASVK